LWDSKQALSDLHQDLWLSGGEPGGISGGATGGTSGGEPGSLSGTG
jgi:hypothetical protein